MNHTLGQLLVLLCLPVLCSCIARKEENQIVPPVTSPLSRDYIGFGVITASFTHITLEPFEDSPSLGYLRRGSLVQILRRQSVRAGNGFSSWVLIEGNVNQQGWLKEDVMAIYDNESQAKTASESMSR